MSTDAHPTLPRLPLAAATATWEAATRLAAAGVDVLVAYHSSALRLRGLPSVSGLLPWASANELTLGLLPGVVVGAGRVPVFATVCANDALRPAESMVDAVADGGARGVLNAPTVGLLTGPVRRALEEAGLGFGREVELMGVARARGLWAWGYAFSPSQARALVGGGAEAIVVHLGITGAGATLDRAAHTLSTVGAAARAGDPGVRVLAHGGPLRDPATFAALRGDHGFFGASVFDGAADTARAVRAWRSALHTTPNREAP